MHARSIGPYSLITQQPLGGKAQDVYKRQGKQVRVLVLCTPDAEAAAKEAGADYVGLDEYIEKIKGGWTDIDLSLIHIRNRLLFLNPNAS